MIWLELMQVTATISGCGTWFLTSFSRVQVSVSKLSHGRESFAPFFSPRRIDIVETLNSLNPPLPKPLNSRKTARESIAQKLREAAMIDPSSTLILTSMAEELVDLLADVEDVWELVAQLECYGEIIKWMVDGVRSQHLRPRQQNEGQSSNRPDLASERETHGGIGESFSMIATYRQADGKLCLEEIPSVPG